jgi:hypothetical protein
MRTRHCDSKFAVSIKIKNIKKYMKRNNVVRDLLILGAFAGAAFCASRYYRRKKQKERELREFVRFQLF